MLLGFGNDHISKEVVHIADITLLLVFVRIDIPPLSTFCYDLRVSELSYLDLRSENEGSTTSFSFRPNIMNGSFPRERIRTNACFHFSFIVVVLVLVVIWTGPLRFKWRRRERCDGMVVVVMIP